SVARRVSRVYGGPDYLLGHPFVHALELSGTRFHGPIRRSRSFCDAPWREGRVVREIAAGDLLVCDPQPSAGVGGQPRRRAFNELEGEGNFPIPDAVLPTGGYAGRRKRGAISLDVHSARSSELPVGFWRANFLA